MLIYIRVLVMSEDIESLMLSTRILNCLRSVGINTIKQLEGCSDKDLLKIVSFGKKSLLEVKAKIVELG